MAKLLVTNGDSAVERLKAAGLAGHFLPWRDMLHDGPVPAAPNLDEVSDTRAAFLSDALGLDFDVVRTDFAARDGQIEIHPAYQDVELWFEHDLYDQLQLIQILDLFAREPERLGVALAQASHYIAVSGKEEIRALAEGARPVSALQLETARAAWSAFTAPTPEALAALAEKPLPALPFLSAALARLLEELPAPGSGLSLTEERILEKLKDGPMEAGRLFGAVQEMDKAAFLSDLAFFLRLDGLAFAPEPLITGLPFPSKAREMSFAPGEGSEAESAYRAYARALVQITPKGEDAFAGRFDHARENRIDRWLGGTHVSADALWRYDRARRRLVAPS